MAFLRKPVGKRRGLNISKKQARKKRKLKRKVIAGAVSAALLAGIGIPTYKVERYNFFNRGVNALAAQHGISEEHIIKERTKVWVDMGLSNLPGEYWPEKATIIKGYWKAPEAEKKLLERLRNGIKRGDFEKGGKPKGKDKKIYIKRNKGNRGSGRTAFS
ncbi:MAG: hypothetical protein QT03_C0001G0476 [archaeon GW2011_AR10]|uniref:Uncharacterized protein n=1 Tax=Candidatus Iainarchaeum sp. TaxID=3101447 RepID=A0A7J4ITE6_9ARCH|nr:MAG: hypothetical protein QT03_C0001G0476 [archaeon GW2011_AR10]HIH08732.1 hypothetical protein [Candidatus Diapherotrites archaeon]